MKIALYHGYELGGSGSNEYTRYLARTLAELGHQVVVICRDFEPERYPFLRRAVAYDKDGTGQELFSRPEVPTDVTLHQLPATSIFPVFIKDKQREGTVKSFPEMSEQELSEYHSAMVNVVRRVLEAEQPDVLHANHLVYQPAVAVEACAATNTPYYVVPHGSSIEYTVKNDPRFLDAARRGLQGASGVAWIAREVRQRVYDLFPELHQHLDQRSHMVGIGTDTSLFTPLAPEQRPAAIAQLKELHQRGGKTEQQRQELKEALSAEDLSATRAYWDAYDHKKPDDDLPSLLERIPLTGDVLFFVGAMTYGKGIQSLVAAMPGILQRRPDAQLVLVGSGTYREVIEALVHALSSGDEQLFAALVAQGQDLERATMSGPLADLAAYAQTASGRQALFSAQNVLAERVHILGRLDHPMLRCIFPCCRLGVFPSVIKEASPLVFAEALANGVLPMGSYHSGLKDGLDDLRPHLDDQLWQKMKLPVEPEGRIAGMVDNVCSLLQQLDQRDRSAELRKIAEERYDWRAIATKLAEVAESMR